MEYRKTDLHYNKFNVYRESLKLTLTNIYLNTNKTITGKNK